MDGVSAASAVAGLAIFGAKLGVQTHAFFEKIKDCSRRVKDIQNDLAGITKIPSKLDAALNEPRSTSLSKFNDKRDEFIFEIEAINHVFGELEALVNKHD